MNSYLPNYDEIYIISDIHMGGEKNQQLNFQIFNNGERLAKFITYIYQKSPDKKIALILNGDIIDSLAEEKISSYVASNTEIATQLMERLYSDKSFAPVWDSLKSFVAVPKRHLVFVIGNHDIELALPVVQYSIYQYLAKNNQSAASRINFATSGEGFTCEVGKSRVFCTHGNELDDWNWIDYNMLGQLANAMNAGRSIDSSRWRPNAGTHLVVDIMNTVKRRYPFVDLLKPEKAAIAAIIVALDSNLLKKLDLTNIMKISYKKWHDNDIKDKLLNSYINENYNKHSALQQNYLIHDILGFNLKQAIDQKVVSEDDLLLDASHGDKYLSDEIDDELQLLGALDIIKGKLNLIPQEEALCLAFKDWLAKDRSFLFTDSEDTLFKDMEHRVGDSVKFVVTGHTHLARAMTYKNGTHYYNCGTWIRLLRLTDEVLKSPEIFKDRLWSVLKSGQMIKLDQAKIPGPEGETPLLLDRTNAVWIRTEGRQSVGDLLHVTETPEGQLSIEPEKETQSLYAKDD